MLLDIPIICLTKCLSSSLNLGVTAALIAICRTYADTFIPAFAAFYQITKYSVLLKRTATLISFLMILAGLPACFVFFSTGSISRLFYCLQSLFMSSFSATNGSKRRASSVELIFCSTRTPLALKTLESLIFSSVAVFLKALITSLIILCNTPDTIACKSSC